MCCSTGVCGPNVDPRLARLASDVAFLKDHGIVVERYNLGHQPEAFTASQLVLAEMGAEAEHLPIFVVDGAIRVKGSYPNRAEMAGWFGIDVGITSSKPRVELRMARAASNTQDESGC